ncbi:oxidoreductase [Streptomyces humidus]|uniref:Oxidoreductase n=1 Tax=Streptomyces humidus TaxID=52259 RepID=A0A918FSS4_9ACTN|nr:GMC family oxidoreductase [Streptomyces humidus]GGR77619.1 oxidoreductase [Streptomyces humidus]
MSGNPPTGHRPVGTHQATGPGLTGPVPRRARIVIVGGGLAGAELAGALSSEGATGVLLLEAGPVAGLTHIHTTHSPQRATELVFAPDSDPYFHRPWRSATPPHYTGISGLRRRLGGRSLYWHGVVLPLEDWALRAPEWPASIVTALTGGDGTPSWYDRVTADLTRWSGGALWDPALPTRTAFGGEEFRPLPRACRRTPGADRWEAYTAFDAWRDADGRTGPPPGVSARCDTEALAVDVGGGRARGVVVRAADGSVTTVAADTVVLCAGAVESTRLAAHALTAADVLPEPRLGGLADHIVQGFVVRLPADRLPPPGSYHVPTDPVLRSYLRMDVHPDGPGRALLDVRVTGEQLPNPDSVVECEVSGSRPGPAKVSTELLPEDRKLIAAQRDLLRDFWATAAAETGAPKTPLEFTDFGDADRDNTRVLPDRTRAQSASRPESWTSLLGTEDHEGGSLPLGRLLDDRHAFTALPGLYAAGPAVFPRLGAANPSLTAIALSRRLAGLLAAA